MDLIKLLQEGDAAGLEMHKAEETLDLAKHAVEQAKERFDLTKNFFDDVIAKAEEAGVPRAKFKKLVEERVAGLWNSGLIVSSDDKSLKSVKVARPPKKVKEAVKSEASNVSEGFSEDFGAQSSENSFEAREEALAN